MAGIEPESLGENPYPILVSLTQVTDQGDTPYTLDVAAQVPGHIDQLNDGGTLLLMVDGEQVLVRESWETICDLAEEAFRSALHMLDIFDALTERVGEIA